VLVRLRPRYLCASGKSGVGMVDGIGTRVGVPFVFIMGPFLRAHELLVDDFFELDHGDFGSVLRSVWWDGKGG
jgi:hypothetical protein